VIKQVVEEVFKKKRPIAFGGAMRVNYGYKGWDMVPFCIRTSIYLLTVKTKALE
jgi:hypothetical protein